MPHLDLECGGDDHDSSSICFSDADEASCYSQSYSTADDDATGDCNSEGSSVSRRSSASDCSVVIGGGRDCRICHLGLESRNPMESGWVGIQLGCACKDDLGAAHRSCAETWFKIKGNKTCEICNSIARNVFGANEVESIQPTNETSITITTVVSAPDSPRSETRGWLNGHRLLNFLLACMVLAFVISWLFHFNIPS